jgi:hypothetical protein
LSKIQKRAKMLKRHQKGRGITPYDLTGDTIWKEGVCDVIDSNAKERTYQGDEEENDETKPDVKDS